MYWNVAAAAAAAELMEDGGQADVSDRHSITHDALAAGSQIAAGTV